MHFLITAGPTREPIDPVRYISNRSSGKMGYALAQAALEAGHGVTLVHGPVTLTPPIGADLVPITTAAEMYEAVRLALPSADVAIFAAAVADYRPVSIADQKIKKSAQRISLELEKTPDILGAARAVFGFRGVLIGFAAETENLEANAASKMERKQCDMLVANRVDKPGTGFDSEENEVILLFPGQPPLALPRDRKLVLAREIVRQAALLAALKAQA